MSAKVIRFPSTVSEVRTEMRTLAVDRAYARKGVVVTPPPKRPETVEYDARGLPIIKVDQVWELKPNGGKKSGVYVRIEEIWPDERMVVLWYFGAEVISKISMPALRTHYTLHDLVPD